MQNQGKHSVSLVWTNTTFAALKSKVSKVQRSAGKAKLVRQLHHVEVLAVFYVVQ